MYAPVHGARIVVVDNDGTRANMSASWLAQMAWEVHVLDDANDDQFSEAGPWQANIATASRSEIITVKDLSAWQGSKEQIVVIDFSKHATYIKGHIPGSYFALRSELSAALRNVPKAARYVITDDPSTARHGTLSQYIVPELKALVNKEVYVLDGGTAAWKAAGMPLETGESRLASPAQDRYKRPYEGTAVPREAMQAYLDWEFGLIEQLNRDGTHHFNPMNLAE